MDNLNKNLDVDKKNKAVAGNGSTVFYRRNISAYKRIVIIAATAMAIALCLTLAGCGNAMQTTDESSGKATQDQQDQQSDKDKGSAESDNKASDKAEDAAPEGNESGDQAATPGEEGAQEAPVPAPEQTPAANTPEPAPAPAPAPEPEPAPAPTPAEPATITVSVSIDSSAATSKGYPASLGQASVTLEPGASVYDALVKTGVSIKYSGGYVSSIGGLSEFALGQGSGWHYYVNGVTPGYSCGSYTLNGGESIRWVYTLDGK